MRVNTRVVLAIKTSQVIERQSYEYDGLVELCAGGGGGDGVDKKFNARMANIAERQQDQSDAYFSFWSKFQRPYEAKQIKYNTKLLPHEYATETKKLETERKGYGLAQEEMGLRSKEIGQVAPVMQEYYKQALEGVDVGEETQRARADVAQGFQESEEATDRSMSRLGVDVTSPAYAERMKSSNMSKAKAVGGAMSQARTSAKDRSFGMLAQATSQFKTGG